MSNDKTNESKIKRFGGRLKAENSAPRMHYLRDDKKCEVASLRPTPPKKPPVKP